MGDNGTARKVSAGSGQQLVGFYGADPGLCISLCYCKVALDGDTPPAWSMYVADVSNFRA